MKALATDMKALSPARPEIRDQPRVLTIDVEELPSETNELRASLPEKLAGLSVVCQVIRVRAGRSPLVAPAGREMHRQRHPVRDQWRR